MRRSQQLTVVRWVCQVRGELEGLRGPCRAGTGYVRTHILALLLKVLIYLSTHQPTASTMVQLRMIEYCREVRAVHALAAELAQRSVHQQPLSVGRAKRATCTKN
jgi:hypothetical protein